MMTTTMLMQIGKSLGLQSSVDGKLQPETGPLRLQDFINDESQELEHRILSFASGCGGCVKVKNGMPEDRVHYKSGVRNEQFS